LSSKAADARGRPIDQGYSFQQRIVFK
jgi:hypothetical protein